MRVKWKMAVGALALAAWVQIPAWSVKARGEVYVSDSLYDWSGNADRSQSSGSLLSPSSPLSPQTSKSQDDYTGPGAKAQVQEEDGEEDLALGVPSVTEVALKEKYHEAYKVYEESMEDRFFFYTNVANGGITDKSVILDIPQNMFVTMEKDGAFIDYTSGKAVSGYGTYVAKLTAIEDPGLPFSEQEEYRAIFRFRIQEKPPQEDGEGLGPGQDGSGLGYQVDWSSLAAQESGQSGSSGIPGMGSLGSGLFDGSGGNGSGPGGSGQGASGGGNGDGTGLGGNGENGDGTGLGGNGENGDGTGLSGDGENGDGTGSGPEGERADGLGADGNGNGENGGPGDGTGQGGENPGGQGPDGSGGGDGASGWQSLYGPRTQVYDSGSRKYEVTFGNGRKLVSNIPEGFMGPGAVEFSVSDGEPARLYCDDVPVEYTPGDSITQPGNYRLDVDGQMWSFVIASAVGDLEWYLAPAGMEITGAAFNGDEMELTSSRYLPMDVDGRYEIALTGESGEGVEVVLEKDTLPPEIAVTVKGGRADIQYLSDDIATITLEKDGKVQEGFSGYVVNSPGSYKLSVADGAGNVSSRQFTLKYRVNVYGIVAVVLVILLIIGGAVFVVHVKRTVKVR